jgi:hypothetical protein
MKGSVENGTGDSEQSLRPLSHFFHTWILRRTFVPETHVRVIMRDNQFDDILPAGYHRVPRVRLTLGPLISIGIRVAQLKDVKCFSRDGIPVILQGRVLFRFDPNHCNREIVPEIVKFPERVLNEMGGRSAARELRAVVGSYLESELRAGEMRSVIQDRATQNLRKATAFLGLTIIGNIEIEHIVFPPDVEEMYHTAYGTARTARRLQHVEKVLAQQLLEVEKLRQFKGGLRVDDGGRGAYGGGDDQDPQPRRSGSRPS